VLYIGVRSVLAGRLTLGELLMVITYLTQLYGPLNAISDKIIGLQPSKASNGEPLRSWTQCLRSPNDRTLAPSSAPQRH